MATSEADLAAVELNPAKTGKRGRKLSPAAQGLMIERIIAGDANREITRRLRANRLLDADDGLSERAFAYYRRLPLCQVQRECLSEAARETAHAELSESVVSLTNQARLARQRLVDHRATLTVQEVNDLAYVQFKTLRLVYHYFGLAGAMALCDADQQPTATGTVADALRRWQRSERDGRRAMAQIGL